MKQKFRIWGFSLLMVLLFVSVVFVPVSAGTQTITPDESNIVKNSHARHADFPLEIPEDLPPAKPLPESEMYIIDIPESWLNEKNSSTDPELIDISISKEEFNSEFVMDGDGHYKGRQQKADEKTVTLRIPKSMYAALNPDPDVVKLSFPTRQFEFPSADIKSGAGTQVQLPLDDVEDNIPLYLQLLADPVIRCTPQTCAWRVSFAATEPDITYMTGSITPLTYTYSGQRYQAFQELENYYNDGVTIEIIAEYDSSDFAGSPIKIFPVVYNGEDANPVYPWESIGSDEHLGGNGAYIPATVAVLPESYEWYVLVNTGQNLGLYQIWLKDVRDDLWYYYDYNDAVNPATELITSEGSSELGTIPLGAITLYAHTQVRNDWCRINEDWKHPDEVFDTTGSFDFRSPDGINWPPYVWIGYSWDNRAWNAFPMVEIPE
ncbi:hypothetical protein [Methanoculleus sp.]|uniref:hypothetical protein n=1 Tax=Methanoculleus sp. TaxID=90427 RepID=UPI0025DE6532|nr:hypothetical protein [Methanoculleus sp.]